MLFVPGSAARFLAFALIFFAEGLGLELVPISREIFESVEEKSVYDAKEVQENRSGNLLDSLFRRRLLHSEVWMLKDIACRGPCTRVIGEHGLQKIEGGGSDSFLIFLCKGIGLSFCRSQELEPCHVDKARPFRAGGCAKNAVDLI